LSYVFENVNYLSLNFS